MIKTTAGLSLFAAVLGGVVFGCGAGMMATRDDRGWMLMVVGAACFGVSLMRQRGDWRNQ